MKPLGWGSNPNGGVDTKRVWGDSRTAIRVGNCSCLDYNSLMVTKAMVMKKLGKVMDPELHVDIVSLGLIYDVEFQTQNSKLHITMTLTTPGCPLAPVIDTLIRDALEGIPGLRREDIELELVWEPAWTKDMMSEETKLKLGMI